MNHRFVVDNSVVMGWCFHQEDQGYADGVLQALEYGEAFVPGVWPLEVGNVLLVGEKRNRLSMAEVIRFLALLGNLPIRVEHETRERMLKEILSLGREQGLTTYDATYLDLAMRMGLPLATLDEDLKRAARHCRVPLFGVP